MGRPKKRRRGENEGGEEAMPDNGPLDRNDSTTYMVEHATEQPIGISDAGYSANAMSDMQSTTFDSTSALDAMLQPWTVLGYPDWSIPTEQPLDTTAPDLTRDNSSNDSPPTFDIPTELLYIPQSMPRTHGLPQAHTASVSTTTQLPTCACLSTLYLTLANLATMDPTFSFPTTLHPVREAMSIASQVLTCPTCPTRFITGLQNVQLLNALLMSLAERFSRILTSISSEADALQLHNATVSPPQQKSKTFRLADLSTPGHLHTGGLGCAAAFSLSFTPAEWRSMAKKVVRAEVYGHPDETECRPYLMGLIPAMEERQDRWHQMPPPEDFPKDREGKPRSRKVATTSGTDSFVAVNEHHGESEHLCLKTLAAIRLMVEGFDWD
jgi:hypothetical protein